MHCFCHRRDCGVAETAAKDWNRACRCVGHGLLATLVAAGGLDGALHFLARSRRTHAVPADERSGTLQAASERTPQGEPVHPTMLPGTATERQRSRRAHSRTKGSHLRGWLGRQNVGRGIAPVSSVLLEEAEGLRGPDGEGPAVAPSRKSRLQWLRRWRRLWCVRVGRVRAADRPSPDACARKATGGQGFGKGLLYGGRPGASAVASPAGPGGPSGRSLPNFGAQFWGH